MELNLCTVTELIKQNMIMRPFSFHIGAKWTACCSCLCNNHFKNVTQKFFVKSAVLHELCAEATEEPRQHDVLCTSIFKCSDNDT